MLHKDVVLFTDRFKGFPERYRAHAAREDLAYRVDCTFHLKLNVTSECGAAFQENLLWALQASPNNAQLDKNWQTLIDKHPKHAAYLQGIPQNEWIALKVQEEKGRSLYGIRTSNMAEQMHAVESAKATRSLHVPELIIEIVQYSGSVMNDVRVLMGRAQQKNLVIIAETFKAFNEGAKMCANYILKPHAQTSKLVGTVLLSGRADGSSATVNMDPAAPSCSKCIDFVQVRCQRTGTLTNRTCSQSRSQETISLSPRPRIRDADWLGGHGQPRPVPRSVLRSVLPREAHLVKSGRC